MIAMQTGKIALLMNGTRILLKRQPTNLRMAIERSMSWLAALSLSRKARKGKPDSQRSKFD
jgi:hypothetical protein